MTALPRVILVHGAVEWAGTFSQVVDLLGNYDVVAVNRRGHGMRWAEGVGSLDDHIGDLLGLLDEGPATVVGHSIGGLAVIGAALRRPTNLRAVGLYETSLLFAPWWTDEDRDRMVDEMDVNAASAVARAAERNPKTVARTEMAWACVHRDVLDGFATPFDWRALAVPITLGYGASSESPAVRDVGIMSEAYGIEPVVLEGAGHRAHVTHPALFADFVIRCVGANGAQSERMDRPPTM